MKTQKPNNNLNNIKNNNIIINNNNKIKRTKSNKENKVEFDYNKFDGDFLPDDFNFNYNNNNNNYEERLIKEVIKRSLLEK